MSRRWSYTLPPDLRAHLEAAMSMRNCGPSDIHSVYVDWLNARGVEPPETGMDDLVQGTAQKDQ